MNNGTHIWRSQWAGLEEVTSAKRTSHQMLERFH